MQRPENSKAEPQLITHWSESLNGVEHQLELFSYLLKSQTTIPTLDF